MQLLMQLRCDITLPWIAELYGQTELLCKTFFLPFSRANTIVMATGPVKGLDNILLLFRASAIEVTAVKNAREHDRLVM